MFVSFSGRRRAAVTATLFALGLASVVGCSTDEAFAPASVTTPSVARVSDLAASVQVGDTLLAHTSSLRTIVRLVNGGVGAVGATVTRVCYSGDLDNRTNDCGTAIGDFPAAALAASAEQSDTAVMALPLAALPYADRAERFVLKACADVRGAAVEVDERNNCGSSAPFTIVPSLGDACPVQPMVVGDSVSGASMASDCLLDVTRERSAIHEFAGVAGQSYTVSATTATECPAQVVVYSANATVIAREIACGSAATATFTVPADGMYYVAIGSGRAGYTLTLRAYVD